MSRIGRIGSLLLVSTGLASAATAVTPLQTTVTTNAAAATSGLLTATATGRGATRTVTGAVGVGEITAARFDTRAGILVGARVNVNTAVAAIAQVTGTVDNGNGSSRSVTATTGLTGTIATPGVSIAGTTLSASRQCTGSSCATSQQTTTTGSIVATSAVPLANLTAYAGAGTVAFTRTASGSTTATNGSRATSGTANGLFSFGSANQASNVYSITYDYVNFANPSFAGATTTIETTLDFGTLIQNRASKTLNFSLFNIGNINSAGLSLTSITRQTNDANFTSSLTTFTNGLDAGTGRDYSAIFAPTTQGMANEMFTMVFGDFAVGGVGARFYQLQLRAKANVIAEPMGVPEPATWAMMILGFGLVGATMRSRAHRGRTTTC